MLFRSDFTATKTWTKHKHSALVGTGMEEWLRKQGIERLIVSGIRTEQCCETTARVAADLGFAVTFVTEATLTFGMTHADGTRFSAEEIKKRTELVLDGRFAQIKSVAQASATRCFQPPESVPAICSRRSRRRRRFRWCS